MNDAITQVHPSTATVDTLMPAVAPLPHRRPRVREVSSRFMSSVVSSSSSSSSPGDLRHHVPRSPLPKNAEATPTPSEEVQPRQQPQRSKSVQRLRQDSEPLCHADENILPDTFQCSETPLGLHSKKTVISSVQRKQPRAAVKLLKENGGGKAAEQQQLSDVSVQSRSLISGKFLGRGGGNITPSRPDTPTVTGAADRMISSKFRIGIQNFERPTDVAAVTAAAKLLQSNGLSMSAQPSTPDTNVNRSLPDLRSSMPEVYVLPHLSTRLLAERSCTVGDVVTGCDSSKFSASSCSRSLNLPLSSCEHSSSPFHTLKASEKRAPANSVKNGSLCLPPLPCSKLGADPRKGRKVFSHQEEMHSLKLLYNHYLQWRYANAKAEASMHAQRRETEGKLYSLGLKISDLHDAVKKKRIELGLLQQTKTLTTILEAQVPYLDEWSTLEGEYSSSLSGAIHALLNASLQLPVSGNVQADIREVGEAMSSAIKITDTIGFHVQSFMPMAEEMEASISELARVIAGERTLIEECGHLLFKTYMTQVEECSLRGHLIQLHQTDQSNPGQPQEK